MEKLRNEDQRQKETLELKKRQLQLLEVINNKKYFIVHTCVGDQYVEEVSTTM